MFGVSYGGALALALGYCLGSIPFGLVLTRLFGAGDLRSIGSGNIGATNVWRTYGRSLGAPVVLLDVLKGFVPALQLLAWTHTYDGASSFSSFGLLPLALLFLIVSSG